VVSTLSAYNVAAVPVPFSHATLRKYGPLLDGIVNVPEPITEPLTLHE